MKALLKCGLGAVVCFGLHLSGHGQDLSYVRSFTLPYPSPDVVWDASRDRLYLINPTDRTLQAVQVSDGSVVGTIPLGHTPESLAMRPDASRLYVGMPIRPHDYYWFGTHSGYLAEVNLAAGTKTAEYQIDLDPYDLIATDAGWVVVSDGSGQWTLIKSFAGGSGVGVNELSIRQLSRLALHPTQQRFYSADTDSGPSDIQRWDIDPGTGAINYVSDSPYHGDHPMDGNVFPAPNGTHLLTRGGAVYVSSADPAQDMRFIRNLDGGRVDAVAFDPARGATFTARNSSWFGETDRRLSYYGPTFELVAQWTVTNSIQHLFADSTSLYGVEVEPNATRVLVFVNPAAGAETNQPPVAAFTWTPQQPTTLSTINFDASSSSDDEESATALNYRWDWESNGEWDTAFTNSPVAAKQFYIAGTKRVRLEVKDRFGAVSRVEHDVSVTHENDPGQPGGGNPAYEMQFAAADLVFDGLRGRLFATDYTGKRLVSLNLTNGFTDRAWTFADSPESVTITPDGQSLYVALLKRPHSGYYFSTHTSRIAEINLPAMQKTREVEIAHDPADIVATDNGMVVVTGGSDQHTELAVVSATTGATLGSGPIYMGARLALHPNQAAVYAGDVGLSPADFRRFSFNPLTGNMGGHWDSRYHGEHDLGYQPWITPDGARIISRGGDVFTSSAIQGNDLEYLSTFTLQPFEDLAFDATNLAVFTVGAGMQGSPGQLDYYHLSQLGHARSIPLAFSPQRVFATSNALWLVSLTSSNTVVTRMDNPAMGAAENVAPVPAFSWTPSAPDTFDHLTFDAGGTGDESPTTLLYRWDWESDGTWDTGFSTNSTAGIRFFVAGTRDVRLQVKDRFGATAEVTHAVTVTQGTDPGQPGDGNPAFALDFVPAAAAFDRLAPRMFAADAANRRIVWVDLNTGLITRQFAMEHIPEALAITPDGSRLYAAMIVQPHQYYTGGQPHRGTVAEFDLTQNLMTRVVEVSTDPSHLAATDAGTLVITDGSNQWTTIGAFSAATGAGNHAPGIIYMGAPLLMMPGQTVFYAVDFQGHRFELDQATRTLTRRWSSSTTTPAGRMFALPAGDRFYTTQGRVYSSSPLQHFDMQQTAILPVEYFADSAYSTNRHSIITLGGSSLSFINPTNYSLVATLQVPEPGQFVGTLGEYVYAVSVAGTNSVITRKRFPALNAEENLPPTITLDAPAKNEVLALHTPVLLSASPEDEDGSITNVTFFVDGSAVGAVSNAPWNWQHSISVAGVHQITAVAADNFGRTATSAVANVTLSLPPSVYLTSPTSLQSIAMPESILLAAEASDADGIARVDFFVDGQLVGASTSAPYRIEIPTLPVGVHQFRAVAIDQLGLAGLSPIVETAVTGFATDDFDPNYPPLTGNHFVLGGNNAHASVQKNEDAHAGNGGGHSLWWSWRAPNHGNLLVSTEGSDFDTLLAVYRSAFAPPAVDRLNWLASNDDDPEIAPASKLKLAVQAGDLLYIAVDGYNGATGNVVLHLNFFPIEGPVNDLLGNATAIAALPYTNHASNVGATGEAGERDHLTGFHYYGTQHRSVWWRWTAPTSGNYEFSTAGSDFDTVLGIYVSTGSPVPSHLQLSQLARNDDGAPGVVTSRIILGTTAGRTYWIVVDGYNAASGNITLALHSLGTPPGTTGNDLFADAAPLAGINAVTSASNLHATHEPGEPSHANVVTGRSLWWRWTAPASGPARLSTKGSPFDTVLAVYTGMSIDSLTPVAANDDAQSDSNWSALEFPAMLGTTYHFAVAGYESQAGTVILSLAQNPETGGTMRIGLPHPDGLELQLEYSLAQHVVVQASENLTAWTNLSTNVVNQGSVHVSDPNRAQHPQRFYRLLILE